jgi:hypothetical protein
MISADSTNASSSADGTLVIIRHSAGPTRSIAARKMA